MATGVNDSSWDAVEYRITRLDIKYGKSTANINTGQIQNFYIEKDFDNDTFPIFLMNIAMSEDMYRYICRNGNDTVFTIVIQTEVNDGTSNKTKRSMFITDKFVPLGLDDTGYTGENMDKKAKSTKVSDLNEQTVDMFNQNFTFILVRDKDIRCSKKIINKVLTETALTDAIGYLLTKGDAKRVLMSALDNTRTYNELVLLPLSLIEQLHYLNSFYGFYKEGAQIFFDFDRLYILENTAKCTAYESNEIQTVTFKVYGKDNGSNFSSGSYQDNVNKKAYIKASSMEIIDATKVVDSTVGTNSIILDSSGNTINTSSTDDGNSNIVSTISHNPYLKSEAQLRSKELKNVVTISCSDINMNLLKPNRQYKIISTESKISAQTNGYYRLKSMVSFFSKNGDGFRINTQVTLVNTGSSK